MGLIARLKDAIQPKVVTTRVVLREKPLREQYNRIGGGIGPSEVSRIMQRADQGQPSLLIDLFNESRQKDGHLQGICFTREIAVALCDMDFVENDSPKRKDKKAIALCRRIVEEFDNFPTLIEQLTSSFVPGHATAELEWRKTSDGLLLPFKSNRIHAREFIFNDAGALRYRRDESDTVGIDLAGDNPGRVIQLQRRITGDVQVREGLIRCLVWAALFRNWSLKDWIALGEIGWKPWRVASYKQGTDQDDIDKLVSMLELLGSNGVAVIPENTDIKVEWPKGMTTGGGSSTHRELLDSMGREMSKAVLGQTTSTEPGANGDRASTETRDKIRADICTNEAVTVAAALRSQLFAHAIALNLGADVAVPVPWFDTYDALDQLAFAKSVEALCGAGLRIPAKWARDMIGSPEPKEGEEILEVVAPVEAEKPVQEPSKDAA